MWAINVSSLHNIMHMIGMVLVTSDQRLQSF
jgi:hypothetical protein